MRWGRFEWGLAALFLSVFVVWLLVLYFGGEAVVSWAVAP